MEQFAIGSDDIGGVQIVGSQAEFATEPAEAAAKGKPGYAGGRVDPKRRGEAEGLRLPIELAKRHSWLWRAMRCFESICTDRIGDRSIKSPPSQTALPAML